MQFNLIWLQYRLICIPGRTKYMPLELKTGRASFSSEHKGQLIIYQMMMSEVGAPVDSGLLLYLREGVMKEIPGTHNERRDLLLLRNEMAHYLTQSNGQENPNGHVALPNPISFRNACTACPYGVICSTYLKQDVDMWSSLRDDHPMKELAPLLTSHLTEADVGYFCHWVGLLTLEEREAQKSIQIVSATSVFFISFFIQQAIKFGLCGWTRQKNVKRMVGPSSTCS